VPGAQARTRFTVVVPTWNRRELVRLTVQSVLGQTRPPERVLVLADGCTDGTVAALRALGDPWLEVLDLPKAAGYAYAHRDATLPDIATEVVMWLGDDDLYAPDHLEHVGARWDAGGVDLVQAQAVLVPPDGRATWMGGDWAVPRRRDRILLGENDTPMGAVSVRTDLVREVGGWDAGLPREGDLDLWQRCLRAGARTAMLPTPTVWHFRGTGRRQAPEDRLVQNRAAAAALRDPAALARLRSDLNAGRDALRAHHEASAERSEEWAWHLALRLGL
jgi:GT2 family glycosyltransferase